jgi:hypothetical protein
MDEDLLNERLQEMERYQVARDEMIFSLFNVGDDNELANIYLTLSEDLRKGERLEWFFIDKYISKLENDDRIDFWDAMLQITKKIGRLQDQLTQLVKIKYQEKNNGK